MAIPGACFFFRLFRARPTCCECYRGLSGVAFCMVLGCSVEFDFEGGSKGGRAGPDAPVCVPPLSSVAGAVVLGGERVDGGGGER